MKNLAVKEFIKEMSDEQIITLWNEYAVDKGDAYIYENIEEVADLYDSPLEFGKAIFFGSVESWNAPVFFNGYENIETLLSPYAENSPIDFGLLAEWVIETEHSILEELDLEEDEEE